MPPVIDQNLTFPGYVVALGGVNLDLTTHPNHAMVMGDSNPGRIHASPGGVARNIAENLCRLGHKTSLISLVGNDAFGDSVLARTQSAGIDVSAVGRSGSGATSTYLSVHDAQGEMLLAVNDMALIESLTPSHLDSYRELLAQADAWVVDANLSDAALTHLWGIAPAVPVFADAVSVAKCGRLRGGFSRIHTLKVNQAEATALVGFEVQSPSQAQLAGQHLCRFGVKRVVVSLGEQGVCWWENNGAYGFLKPSAALRVLNVSGAGDALLAGLVHGYRAGWPMSTCVSFAAACAEITLGCLTANAPNLSASEVQAHLAARHTAESD